MTLILCSIKYSSLVLFQMEIMIEKLIKTLRGAIKKKKKNVESYMITFFFFLLKGYC
jgi:hypothetical protein